MTYYGAKNLAESFRTVRKNTLQIANEIPENKYGFRATPDVMSIGEMLAHVAVAPMWQIEVHSQKVEHIDFGFFAARLQQSQAQQDALRTKAEIISALRLVFFEQFASAASGSRPFSRGSTRPSSPAP